MHRTLTIYDALAIDDVAKILLRTDGRTNGQGDSRSRKKMKIIKVRWTLDKSSTFRNQQLAKRVNLLQEEAEAAAKGKKGGRWRRETR